MIGAASSSAHAFRIIGLIRSGPVAFEVSRVFKCRAISSLLTLKEVRRFDVVCEILGGCLSGSAIFILLEKNFANASTFCELLNAMELSGVFNGGVSLFFVHP